MRRLWILLLSLLLSGIARADPKTLKLGLLTNFPEASGGALSWNANRYLAFQGTYSWALPVKVEVGVPSKKLVSKEEFSIRSPYLDIPFKVDFGPQWSLGALVYPWGGSFYLGLAAAHRRVTILGNIASPVVFEDRETQVESNSEFQAMIRTSTEQELLRTHFGQRYSWGHFYSGWYLGLVQPVSARSRVESQVRVQNPKASDGEASQADNLEDARLAQESILRAKMVDLLRQLEKQSLPLFGIELGLAF